MVLLDVLRMMNTPPLYWIYPKEPMAIGNGFAYVPNAAENWGQNIVTWMKFFFNVGLYSSPVYFLIWGTKRIEMYRENPRSLTDVVFVLTCVYTAGLLLRACGRRANPVYTEFSKKLWDAQKDFSPEKKAVIAKYDFGFEAWPVEFNASRSDAKTFIPPPSYSLSERLLKLPQRAGGWLMINTFGFKMIYPGSIATLQFFMGSSIVEARAVLDKKGGKRHKLKAEDGNHVDSMFFDKRGSGDENGKKLVIVCEGNAGFYEMGMLNVPLDLGYSVIGWNHPGFWGSTGSPFPSQDAHAVDAVMQFALKKLGFKEEDVIVYGWSIGGFTATWLGMNYPNIRAMILDATFDSITPLAIEKMPAILESTVRLAIKDNFDLDVAEQLSKFNGPVRLIRRSKDEMISTDDMKMIETNRGNQLLIRLLRTRHPNLLSDAQVLVELVEYLHRDTARQEEILKFRGLEMDTFEAANIHGHDLATIGQKLSLANKTNVALFLATRYMSELDSTHCTPLTPNLFKMPWTAQ